MDDQQSGLNSDLEPDLTSLMVFHVQDPQQRCLQDWLYGCNDPKRYQGILFGHDYAAYGTVQPSVGGLQLVMIF